MREQPPILNEGNLGAGEFQAHPAESATELGADIDDLSLPFWEMVRTLLLVLAVVIATALIALLV
jgi:hypothetical protein